MRIGERVRVDRPKGDPCYLNGAPQPGPGTNHCSRPIVADAMVTAATASNFTASVFSSACSVAALGAHLLEKRRKKLGDDEPAADGLIFPKLCRLVSMMLPPAVGFLAHSQGRI